MSRSTPPVDFGRTARDYGRFRRGFPDEWFDQLVEHEPSCIHGHVLDLGTGTGNVARGLARRGGKPVALDVSPDLLSRAREMDVETGVAIRYLAGRAEALGLAGASFDAVVAGQCWHWFDGPAAASEAARVLRDGGVLVIAHFDWLPDAGNVVEATEELILRFNPSWGLAGGTGMYPQWLPALAAAGFADLRTASFDMPVPFSHTDWRGRIRASAGVGASLPRDEVARFDSELATLLAGRFPREPLAVPHRMWWVTARSRYPSRSITASAHRR